ncbi:GNAT family N-acetyltransferase [Shimia sp. R9_1]|uniref:GNAT family N-acetyltransferase n=1 Tax=Shimia sp. R9_1 TaxID=2821111 RepID=UPI001ADCD7DC|nr:GNAT family N-acetyltransferase [Shimia sp. R9_1]
MANAPQPRQARADEAPAIARLIDAAYQPYRDARIALPDVSGGVPDAIAANQFWVLEDKNLLGFLMLTLTPPQAHLMNVAVAPTARGRGIGGQLIRFAIAQATAAGCAEIALATHAEMPENVTLYERYGWQICAREDVRIRMLRKLT